MIDFFQTVGINRYVFIDCENAENLKADKVYDFIQQNGYLKANTQIFCMLGAHQNQNKWYDSFIKQIDKLNIFYNIMPLRISTSGDNALDNVLSVYLGLVLAHNQNAEYIIVSFDNGYLAIVEHLKNIGLKIRKETITPKEEKTKSDETQSSTKNDSDENTCIEKIITHFTDMPTKKPQKEQSLKTSISRIIKNEEYDSAQKKYIKKEVISKLEERHIISIGKDKKISWSTSPQNLPSNSKNNHILNKPT